MTPQKRQWLLAAISVAIGICLPLLAAEVALRFLPVVGGLLAMPVDEKTPVFRYRPDQDYQWSVGWDLILANRGHINNAGFVNDADYRRDGARPLFAVIGDSYVEALMVPFAETLQGRLARDIAGKGRVYSFGISGAALSQYLVFAKHARQAYAADAMVFVVVGNDYDESLRRVRDNAGMHLYVENGGGDLELRRSDYEPRPWIRLLLHSALVRYAVYNLKLQHHLPRSLIGQARAAEPPLEFLGNTKAAADNPRITSSKRAVDAFFRDLPSYADLPPEKILFVVDGVRYPPADEATRQNQAETYFVRMRKYFMTAAQRRGYGVIDMDPVMMRRFARHAEPFEDPRDGHWNAMAHGLAADAVARWPVFAAAAGKRP